MPRPSSLAFIYLKEKRESCTDCPFSHCEALELPGIVERANLQKPHAEYGYMVIHIGAYAPICDRIYTHSQRHLPFASFLTIPKKFSRFRSVKKSVK